MLHKFFEIERGMVFMKIRNLLGKVLMMLSLSMIVFAPASGSSIGIEDMPESMKKFR